MKQHKSITLAAACLVVALVAVATPATAQDKPNILVIWGDDIGQFNVRAYNMGMMGYKTPEHRPHRRRRRGVHRLVRPAELHRRPRRLHHRPVAHAHRSDQGRSARRAGRHEEGRPDHRRAAQGAGLHDRPVRQEPPRRPRRDAADQSRLRRVLRQPLPPERGAGAGASRLPEGPGVQEEVRPARRHPLLRRRQDRGHRSADQEAHGDGGRGSHHRGARLHGQGRQGRQAVLRLVEQHPHAHLDAPQGRVRGQDRSRRLRRRHGRARRDGGPVARQARRARHRRQHHRHVLHRQRRGVLLLARRRHDDVPQREGHAMGGRLPRADRDPLARRHQARHGHQRHRRARRHADHAARGGGRSQRERRAAEGQEGRRHDLQGPPRRLQPAARAQGRGRVAAPRVPLLDRRRQRRGAALQQLEDHIPEAGRRRHRRLDDSRSRHCVRRCCRNLRMDPFERAEDESIGYDEMVGGSHVRVRTRRRLCRPVAAELPRVSAAPETRQLQPRPRDGSDQPKARATSSKSSAEPTPTTTAGAPHGAPLF